MTKPTEPGFYWYADRCSESPRIVKVFMGEGGAVPWARNTPKPFAPKGVLMVDDDNWIYTVEAMSEDRNHPKWSEKIPDTGWKFDAPTDKWVESWEDREPGTIRAYQKLPPSTKPLVEGVPVEQMQAVLSRPVEGITKAEIDDFIAKLRGCDERGETIHASFLVEVPAEPDPDALALEEWMTDADRLFEDKGDR